VSIDHWYQLHVTTFGKGYMHDTRIHGPYLEDGLLRQIKNILDPKPDALGEVPIGGKVIRVDLKNGVAYRASKGIWTRIGGARTLENLPRQVAPSLDKNNVPLGVSWREMKPIRALVLLGHANSGCGLWAVSPEPSADDRSQLLAAFAQRNLEAEVTLFEATLTFQQTISVDPILAAKQLKPIPIASSIAPGVAFETLEGQPIVGFRTWLLHVPTVVVGEEITTGEPRLFGPNIRPDRAVMYEWTDAEKSATCEIINHPAPAHPCDCGIYAVHDFEATREWYEYTPSVPGTHVRGAVLGTGNVLVHREGWRAETARIIGFDASSVSQESLPALQRISERFDVPTLSRQELREVAFKHGRIINKRDLEGM
jgi:hypothetical protein